MSKRDRNFAQVPNWFYDEFAQHVSASAYCVYVALCKFDFHLEGGDNTVKPGVATLMKTSGRSRGAVRKALKELAAIGLVTITERHDDTSGRQTSNLYKLHQDPPASFPQRRGQQMTGEGSLTAPLRGHSLTGEGSARDRGGVTECPPEGPGNGPEEDKKKNTSGEDQLERQAENTGRRRHSEPDGSPRPQLDQIQAETQEAVAAGGAAFAGLRERLAKGRGAEENTTAELPEWAKPTLAKLAEINPDMPDGSRRLHSIRGETPPPGWECADLSRRSFEEESA